MEGRRPLPKASHTFPNVVDFRKILGTPTQWSILKGWVVFMGICTFLIGTKRYLRRHEKPPFLDLPKEEIEKYKVMHGVSMFSLMNIFRSNLTLKIDTPLEPKLLDLDVSFQEKVKFDLPADYLDYGPRES